MQVGSRPRHSRNRFRWCRLLAYPPAARRFRPEAYSADDSGRVARRRCSHGGVRVARSAGSALVRLRESLLPLAERYGRALSSALASLETLRLAASQAVERSSRRIKDGPVTGDGCNGASGRVPGAEAECPLSVQSGDLRGETHRERTM